MNYKVDADWGKLKQIDR